MCRQDVSNNLTLAVAPDDFKDESQLDANDFLIRGIIGMDPKVGAIAVGETVGVGKRIRFMVGCDQGVAALCSTHPYTFFGCGYIFAVLTPSHTAPFSNIVVTY